MNQTLEDWLVWGTRRRRLNILFLGMYVVLGLGGVWWAAAAEAVHQAALSAAIFTGLALLLAMLHGIANIACLLGRMCATLDSVEDRESVRSMRTLTKPIEQTRNLSAG